MKEVAVREKKGKEVKLGTPKNTTIGISKICPKNTRSFFILNSARWFNIGGVQKLRLQNLAFFRPPTPFCLHFLWYIILQKVISFDHLFPPPLVNVVCERSLTAIQFCGWNYNVSYIWTEFKNSSHCGKRKAKAKLMINCLNIPSFFSIQQCNYISSEQNSI